MSLIVLYVATAAIFLVADAVMLSSVMKPLFERHLGDELRDGIRYVPATVFYMFYVGVVLYFVSAPALREGTALLPVALNAALLGAFAYGTYEFTSYAVMARWHASMVAADFAWGTLLTAGSAVIGLAITRALTAA
ncbi:hypothetical protein OG2516_01924 [Oceanicola granulosus HTCC2516]|uniref:Transmembrane protein n=1 Tax=Oceanicola granulosus (strain ATCC BAA-861 / DSM 15982 / KCTC 12143 / HTCC2516) TaxID=314256 RepID=Q2CHY9_OCEGH|nr:DUF2177 family protein [Oceanicola granulosus]EAR52155.1 hypothetical protein OG2516_01924 [Oceanicola granulosus HTCC2516]